MSSADDKTSPSAAPKQHREPFPRPWSRGASTSDGEPIYDANGELVMMVQETFGDDEELQKFIVAAVNAFEDARLKREITELVLQVRKGMQ